MHVPSSKQFQAATVLCGVGDAVGFKNGAWEFCRNVDKILFELKNLGGLDNLNVSLPDFRISDDTVLNNASAIGLLKSAKTQDEMLQNLYNAYCDGMRHMHGRAPGVTCGQSLQSGKRWDYLPFNDYHGGCGASMRGMAIGVRFWKKEMLSNLVIVSIESGRMSHHHPTGYLGAVVSALFTSYALRGIHPFSWGSKFRDEVLKLCREHVKKMVNREAEENLSNFWYFEKMWNDYLQLRQIADRDNMKAPVFPTPYGYKEWDYYYRTIAFRGMDGTGGSSGHDSVIIAYDALLGAITPYITSNSNPSSVGRNIGCDGGSGGGGGDNLTYVSTISTTSTSPSSSSSSPPITITIGAAATATATATAATTSSSSSPPALSSRPAEAWRQLLYRGALHGGDSDSTGAIACAWYGALFGFEGVNPKHYEKLEFLDDMLQIASHLEAAANSAGDALNAPWTIGEIQS